MLIVRERGNNFFPEGNSKCFEAVVPDIDKLFGVKDSDLHIYFTYLDEPLEQYFAWATACLLSVIFIKYI